MITLRNGLPVRLRAEASLYLRMAQLYAIARVEPVQRHRWTVRELAYSYTFEAGESADQSRELIAFHWHPGPDQLIRYPHVHLGPAAGTRLHGLDKAHIPTGRLTITDIVRFAITELGVEPLRDDWEDLLAPGG